MTEAHDDYDSPWKNVIEWYFSDLMALLFPLAYADIDWNRPVEFLDKELQQVVRDAEFGRRYADKLAKVWRKNGAEQWVLAHLEVQGDTEDAFDRRMYTYNYRLFDRYGHYVASFAILADTNSSWRPGWFGYQLWECEVNFKFPAVKLIDYQSQWTALESSRNPFATVIMAHLKTQETRHNVAQRRYWKFSLIRRLYEFGYSRQDVLNLIHFIDWLMRLPDLLEMQLRQDIYQLEAEKKMPYVTTFERFAKEEGREEGREEGLRLVLRLLERLLEHRFGAISASANAKLQYLTLAQAEQLVNDALLAKNFDDFLTQIPE